jgi:glycosyltransferase involved in cell wall biosynthesis
LEVAVRVAVFTDNDFEKVNGVTTTLKAVLRFADGSVQARVYTAGSHAVETSAYYSAASIGVGLPWYRSMRVYSPRVRALARELGRQPVDVVHVTTPGPVGLAARHLAARLGVPLVGSYHTELGDYTTHLSGSASLGRIVERYVRWFYRPCDPLLVPSAATRDLLVARGYQADRLLVWGRGVDARQFAPSRASATLRRAWRVDDRRPAVLYAGRLSKEKGLALVGPLRRVLLRHGLPHRFIFVGDGPMRGALEAMCPDGLFLGALPHDEVAAAMASADLFFFPSTTDTLGNVVLEAQAAGLPVIVSDRGGPKEHMVSGDTGFVCRADDENSFARALTLLLTQRPRRTDMGRRAREYAEGRDWPTALTPLLNAWLTAAERKERVSDRPSLTGPRPVTLGTPCG